MNKFTMAIAGALLMGFTIFPGCQSQEKKVEEAKEDVKDAKENVQEAKQDLKEVIKDEKLDAEKAAFEEEWKAFKLETEFSIKKNEGRIDALKTQMKRAGKKAEASYENAISSLQTKNNELKEKMNSYRNDHTNWDNNSKTNWETFKREFNDDMTKLGKALKDFTIDNKK